MKGHMLHARRKMNEIMQNEENLSLIHKKASEDQLVTFCQFNVGALSHYSLSHTLGHLEFSWSTIGGCGILGFLEQEGKGKNRKAKGCTRISSYIRFSCRYQLACMFPSLFLACMAHGCGFLALICHWQEVFA